MSLSKYKAPSKEVPLDDNTTMSVRGLSSVMISQLMNIHYDELETIFTCAASIISVADKGEDFALKAGESLIKLLDTVPQVAGTVIAIAAVGEEETDPDKLIEAALSLPISTQIEIITAIAKLTVTDIGAIKKMFGELKGVTDAVDASRIDNAETQIAKVSTKGAKTKRG